MPKRKLSAEEKEDRSQKRNKKRRETYVAKKRSLASDKEGTINEFLLMMKYARSIYFLYKPDLVLFYVRCSGEKTQLKIPRERPEIRGGVKHIT